MHLSLTEGSSDLIPALRAEISAAAQRLAGQAVQTPLLENEALNRQTGGRLLIKPEVLQRTGSFKFRGAFNRLSALSPEEQARGVVAYSSGNHAQGVARAARLLGLHAAIVMPEDAPAIKRRNTEADGAEIIVYDRAKESREELGARIAQERRAVLVPSYDDPLIIAGQGTAGLEMAADCAAQEIRPDVLLACTGGGGLTAGCALALTQTFPEIAVYTCEPEGYDDHALSFWAGERVANASAPPTLCDALLPKTPGALTFAVNHKLCAGGLSVSEAEVVEAMRFAFQHLKLVVEPGGAVALAAALAGKIDLTGRTALILLSGGNVDPALFAEILSR